MSFETHATSSSASQITAARQTDYIAQLHRAPFILNAAELGSLPGYREDCIYQQGRYHNLERSVGMLDNDFQNSDLDRYVRRFFEYEPRVGVIGDAYTSSTQ